jgi:hypothetical protein
MRRKQALQEAAKVRQIYEEMVLKKPAPSVVTIGSVEQIKRATPAGHSAPVVIGNGNGNGHSNGNGKGAAKPEVAETVAGD